MVERRSGRARRGAATAQERPASGPKRPYILLLKFPVGTRPAPSLRLIDAELGESAVTLATWMEGAAIAFEAAGPANALTEKIRHLAANNAQFWVLELGGDFAEGGRAIDDSFSRLEGLRRQG